MSMPPSLVLKANSRSSKFEVLSSRELVFFPRRRRLSSPPPGAQSTVNPSDRAAACSIAVEAALSAWSSISHFHRGTYDVEHKDEGPSTTADKLADRLIVEFLRSRFKGERFGFLSEEAPADPARLGREALWIVDPIDGTKDFIRGSGDFAIHIGMAEQRGPGVGFWDATVGVVYHPIAGHLFYGSRGNGTWIREEKARGKPVAERWWSREGLPPDATLRAADLERDFEAPRRLQVAGQDTIERMTAVVSQSHRTKKLSRVLELVPFARSYSRGSVGVKIGEVLLGAADVYVNTTRGSCKEWDLCAPQALLEEAGGKVTSLDGDEILYNREDVYIPNGILASNGLAHDALVSVIGPLTRGEC